MAKATTINLHLGYEVGSGVDVEIPLRHMVVAGQTQEAGKTTTLEALISRSGMKAVTFITKRGEGSFVDAHRVEPYFREQTDWQFVRSILEASRNEKLKFETAWIIRASKGARTLADVQKNVQKLMESAKGMSADVYLTLDAYLESVVPQIAGVKWATSVKLRPGVNAVDLTPLNVEMQHLVIRSTIEWVLNYETDTVIVVPEAWKFIPQGRGTPVKLAAAAYIRQGAGLRNYLWLDSQDIGGIEKEVLRSCPVWLLGVQRESNEVKRTLAQIPASANKPTVTAIQTLVLGQFYACWGTNTVKTYVQPAWMTPDQAQHVAKGYHDASLAGDIAKPRRQETPPPPQPPAGVPAQLESEIDAMSLDELNRKFDLLTKALMGRQPPLPVTGSAAPAWNPPDDADEESLYQRFKARLIKDLPLTGGTVQVTPPEKLRKDFQTEEADRIVAAAKEMRPLPKRVLKLVETTSDYLSQPNIAKRLGRSNGGSSMADLGKAVKELAALGFVDVKNGVGVRTSLRDKIAADLAFYQATPADIDAVHQAVVYHIATEAKS